MSEDGSMGTAVTSSLFTPETLACPYPHFAELRDKAPVHPNEMGWFMITRFDDVMAMVRDTDRFTSSVNGPRATLGAVVDPDLQELLGRTEPPVPTLLTNDPPSHARYRALVNKAFTPKRVAQMEGEIRKVADDLIDQFIERGSVDLIPEFAVGLPLTIIADALGVDRADMDDFKRWSDFAVLPLSGPLSKEQQLDCARSRIEMQSYMKARIAERQQAALGTYDDMLNDLVQARLDDDVALNNAEMVGIIEQLLVAGNETTTKLIGFLIQQLLAHPEQLAKITADPAMMTNAVEEALRFEAPVQMLFRGANEDVELHGVCVPSGSMCAVVYASGNRDETKYPIADAFDIERANARTHLSFGQGPHYCIGAPLARAEARIGALALLERCGGLAVDPDAPATLEPGLALRGLAHLPLVFTPGTRLDG
jgi:cytochrome P450